MNVYSIESVNGGQAFALAASAEDLNDVLSKAKKNGRYAQLTRIDGKALLINPEHVFLVGEPVFLDEPKPE